MSKIIKIHLSEPNCEVPCKRSDFAKLLAAIFAEAVEMAVAENDRLGIISYGTIDGKIVSRHPSMAPAKTVNEKLDE